ncbi:MAG: hypothetical protein K0S08_2159 [Gammaproteobacteria bacterium]|jgi:hypothetical protein|nr:hypothetical protein [Gammaproteobacteria bacterium]
MGGIKNTTEPFSLFLENTRFKCNNIMLRAIPDTAHFSRLGKGLTPIQHTSARFITKLI